MPTAAKLIGAAAFAVLAWLVSDLVMGELPEGSSAKWLHEVNAAIGLLMGWRVMGPRAGEGAVRAAGVGLSTVVATVFWCLLAWGGYQMTINSTRMRYDGPVEALQDMANLMVEYLFMIGTAPIVAAILLGGIFCGWLAEMAAQRWP